MDRFKEENQPNRPNRPMTEREFSGAFDLYADAIFRFCLLKTSDREQAKDITQDTFTRTWNHVARGGELSNVRAFLYTTARNLIIDHYRRGKNVSLDQLQEGGFDAPDPASARELDMLDLKRALERINSLEDLYREPLHLRLVEGLGPREIAEILGESENVISVRINRGLKQLRDLLT